MEEVFIIILLLFLSFSYSGSEVAYFSLSPVVINRLRKSRTGRFIARIYETPYRLLSTILLSNTLVNSYASSIFATLTYGLFAELELSKGMGTLLDVIIFTFFLLLFGEVTPKIIALNNPGRFARFSIYILYPVYFIFSPITSPLSKLLKKFAEGLKIRDEESALFEELEFMVRRAIERGMIEKTRGTLFKEALDFLHMTARDIMTPRREIKAVKKEATVRDAYELFRRTRHSRFPVYEGTLDTIVGVVDITHLIRRGVLDSDDPITAYMEQVVFIPEMMKLPDVILRMRGAPSPFLIVIDEFGGTAGLLTRWDIIKSFVGHVREEDETTEEPFLIKKIGKEEYILPGDLPLDEVEEILDIEFDVEGTLGGFIIEKMGRIPDEGEIFKYGGYEFEILSKEGEMVQRVKVKRA